MNDAWSLPSRLRGKYPVGPRLPSGEPEFGYREFPPVNFDGSPAKGRPAIQEEAAARIEALEAVLRRIVAGERSPFSDFYVYRPAAGDEYALFGDHLRAAAAALSGSNPAGGTSE